MSILNPIPGKAAKRRVPRKQISNLLPVERMRFIQARFERARWAYHHRGTQMMLFGFKRKVKNFIFPWKNAVYQKNKTVLQQAIDAERVDPRQFERSFRVVENTRQEIKQAWREMARMNRATERLRRLFSASPKGVIPSEAVQLERQLREQEKIIGTLIEKNKELKEFLETARLNFGLAADVRRIPPKRQ